MKDTDEVQLSSDGYHGETFVNINGISVRIVTRFFGNRNQKEWNSQDIFDLLNDGMKYRLLKSAEELKKSMCCDSKKPRKEQ